MVTAINDLPFHHEFSSKEEAVEKVRKWMRLCMEMESERTTAVEGLYSDYIDCSADIAPGYSIIRLVREFQTIEDKRYLMHLLGNLNTPADWPEEAFEFYGRDSRICAWARKGLVVSLESSPLYGKEALEGRMAEEAVHIANISKEEHLQLYQERLGIRIYESNPKHGRKPYLGAKGRQVDAMDLNVQEAQRLLNKAVEIDGNLYGKTGGQYYAFQRTRLNIYHGYQNNELDLHIKNKIDSYGWGT